MSRASRKNGDRGADATRRRFRARVASQTARFHLRKRVCAREQPRSWQSWARHHCVSPASAKRTLRLRASDGREFDQQGEFVITEGGIEGSLVYALSALARDTIEATGKAVIEIDLQPK